MYLTDRHHIFRISKHLIYQADNIQQTQGCVYYMFRFIVAGAQQARRGPLRAQDSLTKIVYH